MKKAALFFLILLIISILPVVSLAEEGNATRLEAVMLVISHLQVLPPVDVSVLEQYTDVPVLSEPQQQSIAFAIKIDLLRGYEDHTLRLENPITRAEYAAALHRVSGRLSANRSRIMDSAPWFDDIADWNYEDVKFCMDYGLIMGYGDKFGSGDYLTKDQLDIVLYRLWKMPTPYEKYSFLDAGGIGPLDMQKVRESGREERFIIKPGEDYPIEIDAADARWLHNEVFAAIDIYYNLNYRDLDTPEKRKKWNQDLSVKLLKNPENGTYLKYFEDAYLNGLYQESFIATDDRNCAEYGFSGYSERILKGYQYVIYHEGSSEIVPQELELGKWYRRAIKMRFIHSGMNYHWVRDFQDYEPVPEELLNNVSL